MIQYLCELLMNKLNVSNPEKQVSLMYGVAVVTSTAIGVGMMSLPIVSIGMWFPLSIFVIAITAVYIISAGSLLLEVNMNYPPGTGIHSMVNDLMGGKHAMFNDFMMLFNGFILLYAYITVGTEAVQFYIDKIVGFELNNVLSGLLFTAFFGVIFYTPPLIISRILSVFIGLMVLSFIYIAYSLGINVNLGNILLPSIENSHSFGLLPFVFITLPFFMAAMGFQQTIPMLRHLYHDNPQRVVRSIFLGITLVSCIYLVWLFVIMGNQSQNSMILQVASGESSLENIVETLSRSEDIKALMFFFVQVAVVTSFVGVAKGLLDYLMDIFVNHFKLMAVYPKALVILPPLLLSLLFPYGFLIAIGFAGLAGAIWGGIYPALMAQIIRKRIPTDDMEFVTVGGKYTPWFTLLYSFLIIVVMLLELVDFLPKYPN
ncbi:Hypothetical tryptophan-specific transport protein [Photobacterium profundum SS9]|uniref:Hypothetical tryptophan-specific transport protein n=2 Tax=Photobacterium profundum TaxID=74109 RepID=Q6LSH0_PHOPR|nr:Hypothetical tryptophan-specific transport protein [Photobacterium profundum SS9]